MPCKLVPTTQYSLAIVNIRNPRVLMNQKKKTNNNNNKKGQAICVVCVCVCVWEGGGEGGRYVDKYNISSMV